MHGRGSFVGEQVWSSAPVELNGEQVCRSNYDNSNGQCVISNGEQVWCSGPGYRLLFGGVTRCFPGSKRGPQVQTGTVVQFLVNSL